MLAKKHSWGYARHWLRGHNLTIDRFVRTYYTWYDWDFIKHGFIKNPIQAMIILKDFLKPNDVKIREIIRIICEGKSKIIVINGGRGAGKSVLAFYLAERIHEDKPNQKIYFIANKKNSLLPDWIKTTASIHNCQNNSIVIVDEASIHYNAREFLKKENILLGKILAISRHKNISVIFITQNLSLLDVNILRFQDMVFTKQLSSYEMSDRTSSQKTNKFFNKIRNGLKPIDVTECLFEYALEKRFIKFTHPTPEFWTEELSKSFMFFDVKREAEDQQEQEFNQKIRKTIALKKAKGMSISPKKSKELESPEDKL